jgi:hypothetical protein
VNKKVTSITKAAKMSKERAPSLTAAQNPVMEVALSMTLTVLWLPPVAALK